MSGRIFVGTRIRDVSNIWSLSNNTNVYLTNTSNNIGIGKTNPSAKVDVVGDVSSANIIANSLPHANYNNWTKGSSSIYVSAGNIGIRTAAPSTDLDISGVMYLNGGLRTNTTTTTTGSANVANLAAVNSITHYGNMIVHNTTNPTSTASLTEVSGNIVAASFFNINNDTETTSNFAEGDIDISGDIRISGVLNKFDDPFVFRVRDIVSIDNTAIGPYLINSFAYIDKTGIFVANGTSQENLGNVTVKRKAFYLSSDIDEEVDKFYMNSLQTSVITKTGKVFSMGYNLRCSCGIFNNQTERITELTRAFTMDSSGNDISNLVFTKIILSNANPQFTYALTNTGRLYSCGVNSYGQLADGTVVSTQLKASPFVKGPGYVNVGNQNRTVVDVRCAGNFDGTNYTGSVCVLDASGLAWCAGYGGNGANGQGNTTAILSTLSTVKTSGGIDLSNVASIYDYGNDAKYGFFAINGIGELFVWGFNNSTTRFDGSTGNITSATKINSNVGTSNPIVKIWTDNQISTGSVFALDSVGNVYGTGRGYALGVGRTVDLSGWRVIPHFNTTTKRLVEMYILQGITSDADTSVFAITRNTTTDVYTLWATGDNTAGNLGIGNKTDQTIWINVGLRSDIVRRIRRISGFGYHTSDASYTVILLDNGNILYAGNDIPFYNGTTDITRFTLLS
jgi:alpha-tubulin suppressor-like RCC1 family protein